MPNPQAPIRPDQSSNRHPISPSGSMPQDVQGSVTVLHREGSVPAAAPLKGAVTDAAAAASEVAEDVAATAGAATSAVGAEAKGAVGRIATDVAQGNLNVEQLSKVMTQAPVRLYLKLVADPGFATGVEEIKQQGNWTTLIYTELGLALVVILVRGSLLRRTSLWYRHLWTRLWTRVVFWLLAVTAVPWAVFGHAYLDTVRAVGRVVVEVL